MGNLLDKPNTAKETYIEELVEANGFIIRAGISGMQGFRPEMEDQHIHSVMPGAPDHIWLGVFDGHGGKGAANFVHEHFVEVLASTAEWNEYLNSNVNGKKDVRLLQAALTNAFMLIDREMVSYLMQNPNLEYSFGGCTAVTVMITPDYIVCANAGDSRAVLSRRNSPLVVALSFDHKPQNPEERARIEEAGGSVVMNRVDGNLAVSRGLGDFEFKADPTKGQDRQKVSCIPEFEVRERSGEDEMVILACDGLWDVFSNEEAVEAVRAIWSEGEQNVGLVAEEMLDLSLQRGSEDNISAIVVQLAGAQISSVGGGVEGRRQAIQRMREEAAAEAMARQGK